MALKGAWKDLALALREAGYELRVGGSGHFVVYNQKGKRVWGLPSSPSEWRSYQNTLRDLKRAIGFTMPKKGDKR